MTHTPGPWQIVDSHVAATKNYAPGSPWLIAKLLKHRPGSADRVPFGTDGVGNQEANARLIAAAPDLLAACRELLDCIGADATAPGVTDAVQAARAAIAKAEGAP